jgi:hypothetical protein
VLQQLTAGDLASDHLQSVVEAPIVVPQQSSTTRTTNTMSTPTVQHSTSVTPSLTNQPTAPVVPEAAPPIELAATVEEPIIPVEIEATEQLTYTFLPSDVAPLATATNGTHASPVPDVTAQARTLAAYLGWLSAGALQDVFGVPYDEARQVIEDLKRRNVLENIDTPAPRFILPFQKHSKGDL